MEVNLIWSVFAHEEYLKALTYVHDEFGLKAATDLRKSVGTWIKRILDNPEVASPEALLSDEPILYRSIKVGKYNKIIYKYTVDTVFISDFWDMRREPAKLKTRIKRK